MIPHKFSGHASFGVVASVFAIATVLCCLSALRANKSAGIDAEHVVVYREAGRFGGWPANHGIWIWGDEILVGFSQGEYQDLGSRHHIARNKPEYHRLARSMDGGRTWKLQEPKNLPLPEGRSLHGIEPPEQNKPQWTDCLGGIDFSHPDFAMTLRMTDVNRGPSRFAYSFDRGQTWQGPFRLPDMETKGVAARTDYIINGPSSAYFFLTAAKDNGKEGRPFIAETTDGGKTFRHRAWIGPEPGSGYAIMPSAVRIDANTLAVAVRHRDGNDAWISFHVSQDDGRTWEHRSEPAKDLGPGNPPSLLKLADGRLCVIYGVRAEPYRMAAKLSSDAGKTWSEEIVLRDRGGSTDLGYPRSVQRPDGKIVTVYYFCNADGPPERYIAATIWSPPKP